MAKKTKTTVTKKKTGERIEQKRLMKELEFTFTDKDMLKMTKEAGEKSSEVEALTAEFTKVKKEWKDIVDRTKLELKDILRKVREGKEKRTVSCVERKNFNDGIIQYVYKGDVILERDMTPDESQTEMPIHSAKDKWDTKETTVN